MAEAVDSGSITHEKSVSGGSQTGEDHENTEIDCGLSLEKLNLGPKKKLLVLSINGLLVHRVYVYDKHKLRINRRADARYGNHLVFKRPFCDKFMSFCFERFEVGIWSSARERNIHGVLESVMGDLRNKLLFVWDQDECTDSGFKSLEKIGKPLYLKELKKVWETINEQIPGRSSQFSESDTLLIDDKPYKALLNPPNTGIYPEPYSAENTYDQALDPKGKLGLFLDGLAGAEDVQSYVEENSFGQPAVTSSHPEWFYYSKIIRRLSQRKSSIKI